MNSPLSVSSLTTARTLPEFLLLKFSLEQYHECTWHVATDQASHDYLATFPNVTSLPVVEKDEGNSGTRDAADNAAWFKMMLAKFDAIEAGISKNGYSLFLDADIFFVGAIEERVLALFNDPKLDAVLSPQMNMRLINELETGFYNGGMFATRNPVFIERIRKLSNLSPKFGWYYEQQPIQFAANHFLTVNIPIQYNIGWWRFYGPKNNWRTKYLVIREQRIHFFDRPAVCFHAHLLKELTHRDPSPKIAREMLALMRRADNPNYRAFLEKVDELSRDIPTKTPTP